MKGLEAFEKANPAEGVAPMVVWLCTDAAANVNGRDFLVSGSTIGVYSLPEVVAKIDNPDGHMWSLDELDKLMPEQVTSGLQNMWPKKEEKPATA
jgi:hypothetical protein